MIIQHILHVLGRPTVNALSPAPTPHHIPTHPIVHLRMQPARLPEVLLSAHTPRTVLFLYVSTQGRFRHVLTSLLSLYFLHKARKFLDTSKDIERFELAIEFPHFRILLAKPSILILQILLKPFKFLLEVRFDQFFILADFIYHFFCGHTLSELLHGVDFISNAIEPVDEKILVHFNARLTVLICFLKSFRQRIVFFDIFGSNAILQSFDLITQLLPRNSVFE